MRFILTFIFICFSLFADIYPNRPITIVVGFGKGGSSDRNIRILAPFLEKELGVEVKVINIKGDSSNKALKYVLSQKNDGHTILATTFSPYITVNILKKSVNILPKDLSIINIQWFDYDLIAVNNSSKVKNLSELIKKLRLAKTPLKVGRVENSVGDLTLNLLLQKLNIPKSNIQSINFQNGKHVRSSLAKKQTDFIISGSQGSEPIRRYIKTLAIVKNQRVRTWDAPTLNRALESENVQIPIITTLRGYGVTSKFKNLYPKRYEKLVNAFKKVLALKKVQIMLYKNHIGSLWIGDKKSNEYFLNSFKTLKQFSSVISH